MSAAESTPVPSIKLRVNGDRIIVAFENKSREAFTVMYYDGSPAFELMAKVDYFALPLREFRMVVDE